MKTQIKSSNVFKPILVMASMLVLGLVSPAVKAQDSTKPIVIKYLGTINEQPLFQVEFDNSNQENMYLTLKDGAGDILYSESFKSSKFSRKFLLNTPGNDNLRIRITSKNEDQSAAFRIDNKTQEIVDVTFSGNTRNR